MCIERSPYERGRVLFGATFGSDQPPPHPISVGQDSILEMIVVAELSQPSREKRGPCGRTPFSREMLFKFELRGIGTLHGRKPQPFDRPNWDLRRAGLKNIRSILERRKLLATSTILAPSNVLADSDA